MKDGLLDKIRQYGHWRVNFQPVRELAQPLLLGRCRELVQQSAVSMRGWDFPHINTRNDEEGGYENVGSYVENWTDWWGFFEFWRMYRSSQFLSYVALREDTRPDEHGNPTVPVLNTVRTIYSVTEFLEFIHRLNSHGLYEDGALLTIELRNTAGRVLTAGPHRVPFFQRYSTAADTIELRRRLHPRQLLSDYRSLAVELCIELFDGFGWNPAPTQIESDIDRFYRREWAY
jgi:hypothetical protein